MFRQFFDTSFNDYRQVRVVLQELPNNPFKETSADFQRFCTSIFHHKSFTYEQFKIEYCFVKENLIIAETLLSEIQLYRRPFAFIFFTVCHTSEQLRIVLDEYAKIKQREKGVYLHLFVQYKTIENDYQDELSNDEQLTNGTTFQSDYVMSYRPSISSMASVDSYHSLSALRTQDSSSTDGNGSLTSDQASLNDSLNGVPTFSAITADDENEETKTSSKQQSKFSLFKDKNMATTNLFHLFESDLTRTCHRLETSLTKHVLESEKSITFESRGFNNYASPIDSQLADIRLMMDCEKDCSLLENQGKYRHGFLNDPVFKSALNELDMRVMFNLLNQYLKANVNLTTEAGKNKLPKKLIDIRTLKRKGDCCLLLGAIEKAHTDYRNVADALKSQNDPIWHAAALEARVAASYAAAQKPKRQMQKTLSFLKQNSLHRIERYLSRSNTPLHYQDKMDLALQIYNTANRAPFNPATFRLEFDACLRWCSLLWEQNDLQKYQDDIERYVTRINRLGSFLIEHIDCIYLNAYLAETYALIGLKRKSALYYRAAAFSGLTLLNEQASYNDEIEFFVELIKKARTGYGIDDNQLIFPLIQKTVINESIQISLKNYDFTTIIQNVHFAIESLIEYMSDKELEALITFLNASEQSIACSYCSIPRLRSLDLLPLSTRLKPWKAEPKDDIFIYHRIKPIPNQHQSLQRKVDFFWIKNEQVQIVLEVENYLPATMVIDQLEFLTNNQLFTKLETKYRVSSRMKKRLIIDCIPKETGQLRIQGLRYHIWSTNQEFHFEDYPTLRQCICSVDVVDELPILDLQSLSINENRIEPPNTSTVYDAQIYRGEDVFVTLELINSSRECPINTLEIQAFVFGFNMTDYIKVIQLDLPILPGKSIETKIDITQIYDRCLSRQPIIDVLSIEFRVNYSNELTNVEGYYRRNTIEICLNYSSAITFQINDLQNDENDLSYLMFCTIENHLSEGILFGNQMVKPSESSVIPIKQDKIQLNTFPSDVNQLINDIRNQLPKYIYYKTIDSNKQLRSPIDFQYFSNENIQNHFNVLLQLPFTCYWHFQRIVNTLHINLCVISKYYQLEKLEFLFSLTNDIRFLNSNKIIFNNIQPGEYFIAERVLIFQQENASDILAVDVNINEIKWKRINLTF